MLKIRWSSLRLGLVRWVKTDIWQYLLPADLHILNLFSNRRACVGLGSIIWHWFICLGFWTAGRSSSSSVTELFPTFCTIHALFNLQAFLERILSGYNVLKENSFNIITYPFEGLKVEAYHLNDWPGCACIMMLDERCHLFSFVCSDRTS